MKVAGTLDIRDSRLHDNTAHVSPVQTDDLLVLLLFTHDHALNAQSLLTLSALDAPASVTANIIISKCDHTNIATTTAAAVSGLISLKMDCDGTHRW